MRYQPAEVPTITINPQFNPFQTESTKISTSGWSKLYEGLKDEYPKFNPQLLHNQQLSIESSWDEELKLESEFFVFQLQHQFIITQVKSGLMVINQQAAHERVLFEKYLKQISRRAGPAQQELFPQSLEFTSGDFLVMQELQEDLRSIGFDLREFGMNTFVLHGTPPEIEAGNAKTILDSLLEYFKNNRSLNSIDHHENLAKSLARNTSIKSGISLTPKEMKNLIDKVFACEKPTISIDGKTSVLIISMDELQKMFSKF
jgi:DNA mismatch repair protein MutL